VSRHRRAVVAAVALLVAACGNSSDEGSDTTTTAAATDGSGTVPTGGEGDRDTFVPLSGVPGVTDEEIRYTVIGTRSNNPLGTCILDCYLDGVEAYFAYRNDEGGIYGRDLVVGEVLDDELAQNQVRALDVISGNDAFGVFEATLLASGWGDLQQAGIPTYVWGIHATEAANRDHIFPSLVIRCADCTGRSGSYAAMLAGAEQAAALGYGVSENSQQCAQTVAASFELYAGDTGVELAYLNDDLEYGLANGIGPEVTAMKDAGVDFVQTCIDLNGMQTLAQELDRQGMSDVVLFHPNTYDSGFVAEAGDLFEGDFVSVQFLPFEAEGEDTALADFREWMEAQGSEITELAMMGWINATLAFDGLLAAGPEFDRATVVAATNALTGWNAGGLTEPVDWADAHTPYDQATRDVDTGQECSALLRVEDGAFVTVAPPATPFVCWSNTDLSWSEPEPTAFG
jgi:ABC-type branched-subunit amino acid transport system substrate-binding protein